MGLLNLRNALMAGKRLPYDAEVEYLESTGTQWINTGVLATQVFGCEIALEDVATTLYNCFIQNQTSDDFCIGSKNSSIQSSYIRIRSSLTWADNIGASKTFSISGGVINANGVQLGTYDATKSLGANANNIGLFGGPTGARLSQCKIFSCKLYDANGVLVRDYIPVRKGTVGYLYDRVSGALFGNAGTGDFVLGADVVPVEYIESHGTEWIDTGVASGPSNLEFTIDCTITNTIGTIGTGSGVNSVGGLHYVLEQRGIRTGGGSVDNSIPYTSGERVQIRTYYDEQNRRNVQIGDRYYYGSAYSAPTANLCLLRMVKLANQKGFFFSATVSQSGALVRKFLPVRVGSGSTWEGAMMDVLTRRIYRNAGTGAFTYGNDLKYPIPA